MIKVAAGGNTLQIVKFKLEKLEMKNILGKAAVNRIDFVCLPEGFLTGYYVKRSFPPHSSLKGKK